MCRKQFKIYRLYRIRINETLYFTYAYSRKQAYLQIAIRLKIPKEAENETVA